MVFDPVFFGSQFGAGISGADAADVVGVQIDLPIVIKRSIVTVYEMLVSLAADRPTMYQLSGRQYQP